MLIKLVRVRAALLACVFVIGVLLAGAQWVGPPYFPRLALVVLILVLQVTAIVTANVRQPATFVIRDGAFTTPPPLSAVLLGAGSIAMAATVTGQLAHEDRQGLGLDPIIAVAVVLAWIVVALHVYRVLGSCGLYLRPDGVYDREPLGTIFVPWEAGVTAEPISTGARLTFTNPDLVVRRGIRPRSSVQTGADIAYTAAAINLFASLPDLRPAIGTDEGLPL